MTTPSHDWIDDGRGVRQPALQWSFDAGAALLGMDLARESGDAVLTGADGQLHLLGDDGAPLVPPRAMAGAGHVDWSDAADGGVVRVGDSRIGWVNRSLKVEWTLAFHTTVSAIATAPFGNVVAVSLEDQSTHIFDTRQQSVAEFTTARPLRHLHFVSTRPRLIGSADSGVLCSHSLNGEEQWVERNWTNIGGLAVSGNGRAILLAAFNHGIQCFNTRGVSQGFYDLDGTVSHVAISYIGTIIAASTVEGQLFLLDVDGKILWQATCPDTVAGLICGPFGERILVGFESGLVQQLRWAPWRQLSAPASSS